MNCTVENKGGRVWWFEWLMMDDGIKISGDLSDLPVQFENEWVMQVVYAFSQVFLPLLHQPTQPISGHLFLLVVLLWWSTHGKLLLLVELSLVKELLFEESAIIVSHIFASSQLMDSLFV